MSYTHALFYPFHLCHEITLHQILRDYQQVHFRDYMALRLSPMMGTVAYQDRMGDEFPKLVETGRIVQGHHVSGSMSPEVITAVDRDLADTKWRSLFHHAVRDDRQFQRGIVTFAQDNQGRSTGPKNSRELWELQEPEREVTSYTVEWVRGLSGKRLSQKEDFHYDYGLALIKTSVALIYTIQLCHQLKAVAVTDSATHYVLLARTCQRDRIELTNHCVKREGY